MCLNGDNTGSHIALGQVLSFVTYMEVYLGFHIALGEVLIYTHKRVFLTFHLNHLRMLYSLKP